MESNFIEKEIVARAEALWLSGKSEKEITAIIEEETGRLIEIASTSFLELLKETSYASLREHRLISGAFQLRLEQRWYRAFDLLDTLVECSLETVQEVNIEYKKAPQQERFLFEALFRLHARAICISREIIVLIKSGYADGAFARWRSLFEIVMISLHLNNHGDELSEKYLIYQVVEDLKEAKIYFDNFERLGFAPISEKELDSKKRLVKLAEDKFGSSFSKSYGWAIGTIPTDKQNFLGILASLDQTHWKPFYNIACSQIHSGSKALYSRVSHSNAAKVLLTGPTNIGFTAPAENTAISLLQLTAAIIRHFYTDMRTVVIAALNKLSNEISHEFNRIQRQIDQEEQEKKRVTNSCTT